MKTIRYDAGKVMMQTLTNIVFSLHIEGLDNYPKEGSGIITPNHAHWVDIPIVGAFCPRKVRFVAKKELFTIDGLLGRYVKEQLTTWKAIPVDRQRPSREFLRECERTVSEGEYLMIVFPQGTRNKEGKVEGFKDYASTLACKYDVPLIPVGFIDTYKIKKPIDWMTRKDLHVTIGKPIHPRDFKIEDRKTKIECLTAAAENEVYYLVNGKRNEDLEKKISGLYKI
jgi:1-acyl-sn-glycerol-3-phosphate acyltransferase